MQSDLEDQDSYHFILQMETLLNSMFCDVQDKTQPHLN